MATTPQYPNLDTMSYRDASTINGTIAGTSVDTDNDMGKLWLPIWSGEVLHAYDEYKSFEPMVTSKMIESGRSIEFPITGVVSLKPTWGAGEYLYGGDDSRAETFTVTLDKRPMAAHFELDNIDLMITQWEYRQELARQAGQTLANARDEQVGAFLVAAGAVAPLANDPRVTAGKLSFPAPAAVANTEDAAAALQVLAAIEEYIVDCQVNNIPADTTYCAVNPRLFQQIRRLGVAEQASDVATGAGRPLFGGVAEAGGLGTQLTSGMRNMNDSLVYMGVTICKSNHLPTADGNVIGEARYTVNGAAAGVEGVIWQPGAVASVRKTGLVVDTEDDVRRNTTFTVASMMSGTGIVKPELAKVLTSGGATADTRAELLGLYEDVTGQFGYAAS
jgi:hypothetical protein